MGAATNIEWTERTWNPTVGCSVLSPGCRKCYAMTMARRLELMGQAPTTWFVNSMSDLFHEEVPDEWIDRVFAVMALSSQHTFQVLTKRAERMQKYMLGLDLPYRVVCAAENVSPGDLQDAQRFQIESSDDDRGAEGTPARWPLPNVWLGVSAEDQQRANERIPHLLATPAAVRFVSAEPLLGSIDFRRLCPDDSFRRSGVALDALIGDTVDATTGQPPRDGRRACQPIDWIIVGGESGQGARPMHPDWARQIRDQCAAAGVPFFMKQWGEFVSVSEVAGPGAHFTFPDGATVRRVGKARAGRLLDSVEHNGMPVISPSPSLFEVGATT